jgi:predicted metal-dependent HD superfamily phosphohydrolase
MTSSLEFTFKAISRKFVNDERLIESLWQKIVIEHSTRNRHYHNLNHLEYILVALEKVREKISDWDAVIFSIVYHDIVYRAHRKDNEAQSMLFAKEALASLQVGDFIIAHCIEIIHATKGHSFSNDEDVNYFTDADLSILGSSPEQYMQYARAVRQEYRLYPDLIYRPGRKKVLQHFLAMDRIFKTAYFFNLYEEAARQNLTRELHSLHGKA